MTPFLIAGHETLSTEFFRAFDPARGIEIEPAFAIADASHVREACAAAAAAFDMFGSCPAERRALLLEGIATRIEAISDDLIVRAMAETGLPRPRLEGERGRTVGQLRLFAATIRGDDWRGRRFDPALPDRQPLARPALHMIKRPLGPVAVFGASNFPLAFSVAGGDTASALAAGCPVIVKGHPAHPGVSMMVGGAIRDAITDVGLPAGIFSLLAGPSHSLGTALMSDPAITAVGFTGSRSGGLALVKLAQSRAVPIPVYAEMSSVNPVVLFPSALASRGDELAAGFVTSLTGSGGQLCTNPGLIFAIEGAELDRFLAEATRLVSGVMPFTMLTAGIADAYRAAVASIGAVPGVESGTSMEGELGCGTAPALFAVDAERFIAHPALREEIFGHASLVVRCRDLTELRQSIAALEGQLTLTLQIDPQDYDTAAQLLPLFEQKAGRVLANGWPTGVEVSSAMVHGGPFPATYDGRSTSVGTLAIDRFLRPVCYQNMPEALLATISP